MQYIILLLLISCACQKKIEIPQYERKAFRHWIDENKNCRNTRHEILATRSLAPVQFRPHQRGECRVIQGLWPDYYFDEKHTDPSQVDIDHLIPLKHAWDIGAHDWSDEKRKEFANDPENLVITNRKYNRQKGSLTIAQWLPIDRQYACKYIGQWYAVKEKYKLPVSAEEHSTKRQLKCDQLKN